MKVVKADKMSKGPYKTKSNKVNVPKRRVKKETHKIVDDLEA